MGHDLPDDPEEIDPLKWYKLTTIGHWDGTMKTGCDQDYVATHVCCQTGAHILAWQAFPGPCLNSLGSFLCFADIAEFIVSMAGPYDDFITCNADI